MTTMNTHSRSLAAALDMVEAAISSLENQARLAKLYEQQQQEQNEKDAQVEIETKQTEATEETKPQGRTEAKAIGVTPIVASSVVPNSPVYDEDDRKAEVKRKEREQPSDIDAANNNIEQFKVQPIKISTHGSKKHKSSKKVYSTPGVLLHHRNSSPKKKGHRRSGSSSRHHHHYHRSKSSSYKREKNNNDTDEPTTSRSVDSAGYSQATLSSKIREHLTEKPKKKDKGLPFIPAGGPEGKSYHVGVIIQKELGQLKSQPLEIWASAKNAAKNKEAQCNSTILERALTKS